MNFQAAVEKCLAANKRAAEKSRARATKSQERFGRKMARRKRRAETELSMDKTRAQKQMALITEVRAWALRQEKAGIELFYPEDLHLGGRGPTILIGRGARVCLHSWNRGHLPCSETVDKEGSRYLVPRFWRELSEISEREIAARVARLCQKHNITFP